MPGGLRQQPKVFRGAFVEYGLSFPPLVVVFQYNPEQLSRSRSQLFSIPGFPQRAEDGGGRTLRDFHQDPAFVDLLKLRDAQVVTMPPESLSFEIRLDATDKLNDGDAIAELHGIGPQLATLELMVAPKSESLFGAIIDELLPGGFSFTDTKKPPMVLFIWGPKRVLPVNINSLQITETEFSTELDPIRATVAVDLTVIEGPNPPSLYSKLQKESMAGLPLTKLALATLAEVKEVFIPR